MERLKKEQSKLQKEIDRCNQILGNEKFISKAPASKIEEEKAKLVKYQQMFEQVNERIVAFEKK